MSGVAPNRFCFPHAARITEKFEFTRVFQRGEKIWGRAFICYVLLEANTETRLGLVVSRKVGGSVVRNRVKRGIREFFRLNRHRFEPGAQLVVVARAAAARNSGVKNAAELAHVLAKRLHHDS